MLTAREEEFSVTNAKNVPSAGANVGEGEGGAETCVRSRDAGAHKDGRTTKGGFLTRNHVPGALSADEERGLAERHGAPARGCFLLLARRIIYFFF